MAQDLTGAEYVLQHDHAGVHQDTIIKAGDLSVDADSPIDYLIQVPPNMNTHLILDISSTEPAQMQLFEGVEASDSGVPIHIARANRTSIRTTHTRIGRDPVITDLGEELPGGFVLANGRYHTDTEWLLKFGMSYLIRITSSKKATIQIEFEWHEREDKT